MRGIIILFQSFRWRMFSFSLSFRYDSAMQSNAGKSDESWRFCFSGGAVFNHLSFFFCVFLVLVVLESGNGGIANCSDSFSFVFSSSFYSLPLLVLQFLQQDHLLKKTMMNLLQVCGFRFMRFEFYFSSVSTFENSLL